MACGAATAYRNYFVPMEIGWEGSGHGQSEGENREKIVMFKSDRFEASREG